MWGAGGRGCMKREDLRLELGAYTLVGDDRDDDVHRHATDAGALADQWIILSSTMVPPNCSTIWRACAIACS